VAYLRCDMMVMSVSGGRGRKGRQEQNERKNRVRAGAAHLKLVVDVDWTMGRSPHTQKTTPDPWAHHTHGQECRQHCTRKQAAQTFKAIGAGRWLGAVEAIGAGAHRSGIFRRLEDKLSAYLDVPYSTCLCTCHGMSQLSKSCPTLEPEVS
jgi:hypothetical protein